MNLTMIALLCATLFLASPAAAETDDPSASTTSDSIASDTSSDPELTDEAEQTRPVVTPAQEALSKAMEAPTGMTPCETAFNSLSTMTRVLQDGLAQDVNQGAMPPKQQFITACNSLPTIIQNCLAVAYAVEHQEECRNAESAADPSMMEQFKQFLPK